MSQSGEEFIGIMTADTMITDVEEVPEWLDNCFAQKCLQNHCPDSTITVHSFDAQLATAKGENYVSIIYRATAVYSEEQEKEQNVSKPCVSISN